MCVVQGCFHIETRVVGQRGIVLIFEHFQERANYGQRRHSGTLTEKERPGLS